eukprot:TRINITY_DN3435_c0_g1_i2.p1 TRINITY_DN3435_c0_g1~~TRINITY_DN3435_c0_g1_i2.p1  ORF type:complete len:549 (-),score=136.69 TRINITY_DN3435_c0_g1_i2:102-1685(-)
MEEAAAATATEALLKGERSVAFVASMFPSVPEDVVRKLLAQSRFDVAAAVDVLIDNEAALLADLLGFADTPEATPPSIDESDLDQLVSQRFAMAVANPPTQVPADYQPVAYSHPPQVLSPPAGQSHKKKRKKKRRSADGAMLGGSDSAKTGDSADAGSGGEGTTAQSRASKRKLQVDRVADMFPSATRAAIESVMGLCNYNASAAVEVLLNQETLLTPGPKPCAAPPTTNTKWASFSQKIRGQAPPPGITFEPPMKSDEPTLSDKIKLSQLVSLFEFVDPENVRSVFEANDRRLDQSIATMFDLFPYLRYLSPDGVRDVPYSAASVTLFSQLSSAQSPLPQPPRTKSPVEQPQSKSQRPENNATPKTKKKQKRPPPLTLQQFHLHSRMIAQRRASLYRRAASAFVSGEPGMAKELAELGNCHSAALQALKDNVISNAVAHVSSLLQSRDERVAIDLHGYTVEMAEVTLNNLFSKALEGGVTKLICIITGVGSHSAGAPRLFPMVKQYLQENKLHFQQGTGLFLVNLK